MDTLKNQITMITLIAMCAFGALSIDIVLPELYLISKKLNASYQITSLTISLFLLGFSVSQLIIGPVSDKWGRKKILLLSLTIYCASSIFCLFSGTINTLIFFRITQSIGACGVVINAMSLIKLLYEDKEIKVFSLVSMFLGLSPILAPLLGSYITNAYGWKCIFAIMSALSAALFFYSKFTLIETQKNTHCSILPLTLFFAIFKKREYLLYCCCISISFSILFIFVVTAPYIYINLNHFSIDKFSIFFSISSIPIVLGSLLTKKLLANGLSINKLITFGSFLIITGSAIMLFSFNSGAIVSGYFYSILFITFGVSMIAPSAMSGALKRFSGNISSVIALTNFSRFITASFFSFVALLLIKHNVELTPLIFFVLSTFILFIINFKEKK